VWHADPQNKGGVSHNDNGGGEGQPPPVVIKERVHSCTRRKDITPPVCKRGGDPPEK